MTDHTPELERMLELISDWEQNEDRRAIFLSCYAQMTANMLQAVEQREFHDAEWVENLIAHFADYYFHALEAHEWGLAPTPRPWLVAFDAAQNPQVHVLQHLLLGVNAHINYDLCFAVEDALRPEWTLLDGAQRQQRYQDHCHINLVIARTIDAVQDQVIERYSPAMELADRMLGRLDETVITQMIASWRGEVWEQAIRLVEEHPQDRPAHCREIEDQAAKRAQRLLGPKLARLMDDLF